MATKPQAKSSVKRSSKAVTKAPATRRVAKSSYINARVEPKLKKNAEAVLDKIGLSTTDAVTLFLTQVVAHKGMPFPVKIPNRETIKAMRELERGGGTRHEGDVASLFQSILRPKTKRA